MGLQVKYRATQMLGECNCFIFEDNTGLYSAAGNPCGYGAPNIPKSDITRTEIYIVNAKGNRYKVNRDYLPTLGPIKICTTDLLPVLVTDQSPEMDIDGCGCPQLTYPVFVPPYPVSNNCNVSTLDCDIPVGSAKIADGCNIIEYYVYGPTTKKKLCNYSIGRTLALQSDQKLWALQNGILIDITDSIVDGSVVFMASDDIYTNWFIKTGDRVEFCGTFTISNCIFDTLDTPVEALLSYVISKEVFVCNTETKLSELTYKVSVLDDNCVSCKPNEITKEQANYLFAIAWAKLHSLKNNPGCNCTCVKDNLEQINKILDTLKSDC